MPALSREQIKQKFNLIKEFSNRFDNVAKKYEKVTFGFSIGTKFVDTQEQQFITDLIHNQLNTNGKKVLDVGAGNGRWSKLFLNLGWKVHSLDNSSEMCGVLSTIKGLSVVKGDIQEVELNEKFDVIFAMRSLKYTDLKRVLENARKLCARKGIFVFELPFRYNPFYFSFCFLSTVLIHILKDNRHIRYFLMINFYDKSSVESIASGSGYRILRTEKLFFFPDFIYSKINNELLLSLMKAIDRIFSKIFPRSLVFMAQPEQEG